MSEFKEKLNKAMPRIAQALENELVLASPVDKGFLRNSIRVKATSRGVKISMKEYGKWVEFGTPPHVINPKNKKALKFKGKDGAVIVKRVMHPGTRPNPFIRNTIQLKIKEIIIRELSK